MKLSLAIALLLMPFLALAQQHQPAITYINADSMRHHFSLDRNWRFHAGDTAAWAAKNFNDSLWEPAETELYYTENPGKTSQHISGICWLRLHIMADSDITGKPLALLMAHTGASQIYLDGTLLKSFGVIGDKKHTEYENPGFLPFTFTLREPGEHTIAVRYANYHTEEYFRLYHNELAGFQLIAGRADNLIDSDRLQAIVITGILVFLFGIFIALSLLHFLIYLYSRSEKSNLYFSLFSFSLALLFFLPFLGRYSTDPGFQMHIRLAAIILASVACFSLSGFTNVLFSRTRWRFGIITLCCIMLPVFWFLSYNLFGITLLILIAIVSLEAIGLIIRATWQRVRGAMIIGFGILFFALFLITLFILAILKGDINDATPAGKALEFIAAAAVLSIPVSISIYLAWRFADINKDLKNQLRQVKLLSEKSLEQEAEKKRLLESRKEELELEVIQRTGEITRQKSRIEKQNEELKLEKAKSDELLRNILPEEVAEELKQKGTSTARLFDDVTVLFTDFVDFTRAGERMSPQELVNELNTCFMAFDSIISKYNIEKIKTIGDAYLAVCGLPLANANHADLTARAALDILKYMEERKQQKGENTFEVRIGMHSGSVVAGIVGVKKFAYDIWGDTVNTAARMEQSSEPGRINISQVTYERIKDLYACTFRGEIDAKNKGAMRMYFIEKEL